MEVTALQNEDDLEMKQGRWKGDLFRQVVLVLSVIGFGCGNNISKQIAAKPLVRFTYMLGLSTAVAYVPIYFGILYLLIYFGLVPRHQLHFLWGPQSEQRRIWPIFSYIVFAALCDALGDVIGMVCTPSVTGPVHSLLSNFTSVFIAFLSICMLDKRYSLLQCSALAGVAVAVIIGTIPAFQSSTSSSATNPFYAVVLGGSCIFNALAFVVKEMLFRSYEPWANARGLEDHKGLSIFVVNSHEALFQLPFTLLVVPVNEALGQTKGEGIFQYLQEAFHCVFAGTSDACGAKAVHGELAGVCIVVYVVFNILWNLSILLSVKNTGALTTFVALKVIFPVSAILFAYVSWPLLGTTTMNILTWVSVVLLLPAVAAFQFGSFVQDQRQKIDPAAATCCWPLFVNRRHLSIHGSQTGSE